MPKITIQQAIALSKGLYIDPVTSSNSAIFSNPPTLSALLGPSCDLPSIPQLGNLTSATYTLVNSTDDLGGIYGKLKCSQFLRDLKNKKDSLDFFVIGDSNANINGWGWADGLAYSLETDFNIPNYATPIYSAFSKTSGGPEYYGIYSKAGYFSYASYDEPGSQTWSNLNELGSPNNLGGKFFRGSQNTYPTLTTTLTTGSGLLQPNSNRFDFGVIADDPAQGSGTQFCTPFNGVYLNESPTPWIRDQLKYRLVHAKGNGFGTIKPVFILNVAPYTPYAAWTINCNDAAAQNPYWTTTEMVAPADSNRSLSSSMVFAFSYSTFNLTYEGTTYTNGYTTFPAAIALQSVCRNTKGFSVTCLNHHGGATIAGIETDVVQGNTVVKAFLKEAVERQISCGGTGRVLFIITAGMNAALATDYDDKVLSIVSSVKTQWKSLGYSLDNLGFLVIPSHQANTSDNYPGPAGSTLSEVRVQSLNTISNTDISVCILPNLISYTLAQSSSYLQDSNSAGGATGFIHLTELGSKEVSKLVLTDLLRYGTDLDLTTGGSIRTNNLGSVLNVNTAERNYHISGIGIFKKIKK